ncbi:UNVERIFIED_CONTAM: hypothetical protein FKN15_018342 [Acipenser sinensis]
MPSPIGQTANSSCKGKKVVSHKRKSKHQVLNPCGRRKQPPLSRGCDMANKENEVACASSLHEKLHKDRCTFPVNSGDSTKMECAASKYSDYFTESDKGPERNNCNVGPSPTMDRKGLKKKH